MVPSTGVHLLGSSSRILRALDSLLLHLILEWRTGTAEMVRLQVTVHQMGARALDSAIRSAAAAWCQQLASGRIAAWIAYRVKCFGPINE